jgi:clostripain
MSPEEDLELDSSDPANLERFVAFCKERFPAQRYGLMVYSHANGQTMCPDEESGGEMGIPQLAREVDESASVDFLALELCNMAGIEIAYEWRPGNGGFSADVLVAIPNAGPPLDWDRAFARVRSGGHASEAEGALLTKYLSQGVGRLRS